MPLSACHVFCKFFIGYIIFAAYFFKFGSKLFIVTNAIDNDFIKRVAHEFMLWSEMYIVQYLGVVGHGKYKILKLHAINMHFAKFAIFGRYATQPEIPIGGIKPVNRGFAQKQKRNIYGTGAGSGRGICERKRGRLCPLMGSHRSTW